MKKLLTLLVLFVFAQCKTVHKNEGAQSKQSTAIQAQNSNGTAPEKSANNAYPREPGTCVIVATVLDIFPVGKAEEGEPFNTYPCKAKINILELNNCGYGVPNKPAVGSDVEVNFIYTTLPTNNLKLKNKPGIELSGLKVGQTFDAQVKITELPTKKLDISIGLYELKRN